MPHVTFKEGLLQEACLLGRLEGALVWSPWGVRGGSPSSSSLSLPRGSACLHKTMLSENMLLYKWSARHSCDIAHTERAYTCSVLFGGPLEGWLHSTSLLSGCVDIFVNLRGATHQNLASMATLPVTMQVSPLSSSSALSCFSCY